ncbi:MAG: hypothetical protein JXD22_15305 [Sedimentisphaerales bacterium]|nr:hypothetical protein [Sedimentisphaerales bacterium]
MQTEIRTVENEGVVEVYITALPASEIKEAEQVREIFSGIAEILRSSNLYIMQERVFGTQDILEQVKDIRLDVYGALDDGVIPSWLVVPKGIGGELAGVQVHALGGIASPEVLCCEDKLIGRRVRANKREFLTLSAICAPEAGRPDQQARSMLEKAGEVLGREHVDMFSVPRTWMWLNDILSWYDDFNRVRNEFFSERGLIGNSTASKMPASTGIGIGPHNAACAMDIVAVIEPANALEYLDAGGKQGSALSYGSAFSRATRAVTPAGKTIFVSGTASIGSDGETTNIGDAGAQIEATISNVRAVLKQLDCGDDDVVQAMAYCKTPEIEKLFYEMRGDLNWPFLVAVADVCRDNLLFEIEATAALPG